MRYNRVPYFIVLLIPFLIINPGIDRLLALQKDGSISFLVTGDALISLPLSNHSEPEFTKLIEIIRGTDVAITNLEMLIHTYKGYPQAESGGTYMTAEPSIAKELVWAGFDMAACANNHSYDYGLMGLLETEMYLNQAGLVHAGFGMDLQRARLPGILQTEKGTIALLSCASSFISFGKAGRSRPDLHGRPGLNPLTVTSEYTIDSTTAEKFMSLAAESGIPAGSFRNGQFRFLGRTFTLGSEYSRSYKIDERDLKENLEAVKKAKENSDWVIMSIHAHQGGNRVPDFLIDFAHACIDNGADIVFGHGPHYLKGMEIYNGKPIFYSLGNFIFQNETIKRQPSEFYDRYGLDDTATPGEAYSVRTNNDTRSWPANPVYWESVVPVIEFENKKLKQISLYPLTLGFGKPRGIRGRPLIADEVLGKKLIDKMKELSEPFGVEIQYRDNIGYIRMDE